jgi:ABC-type sugar transport system permease subunit
MQLHIAGTGVNQYQQIATKAKEDLGVTIQYTSLVSDDVVKRAATQPTSFDLLDSEYWMLAKIIPTGNMRGLDVKRIGNYERIVPIFTKGILPDGQAVSRQGTAPIKVSYRQGELASTFATEPSQWMTLIPTVYNADTLGIRPDLIGRPITQWRELLSSSVTYRTYLITLHLCVLVWALTLLLGFPIAYFLAFHVRSRTWQMGLFLLCTIPFWTSNVIRMIAWIPLLGRHGVVHTVLQHLGVVDAPLEWLLYSEFAVVVGYIHLYTLFMIVPIFNAMMRIDRALLKAAGDSAVTAWQTLWAHLPPPSRWG